MDNRTWTPWYYEYPWYSKTEQVVREREQVVRERDQARRVARALYAVYLQVKDISLDGREDYLLYEALRQARRVLAEEAR